VYATVNRLTVQPAAREGGCVFGPALSELRGSTYVVGVESVADLVRRGVGMTILLAYSGAFRGARE
jgi:hypothetical protein